ncbi:hypothetical protein D9M69_688760 [compost metagenome]
MPLQGCRTECRFGDADDRDVGELLEGGHAGVPKSGDDDAVDSRTVNSRPANSGAVRAAVGKSSRGVFCDDLGDSAGRDQ